MTAISSVMIVSAVLHSQCTSSRPRCRRGFIRCLVFLLFTIVIRETSAQPMMDGKSGQGLVLPIASRSKNIPPRGSSSPALKDGVSLKSASHQNNQNIESGNPTDEPKSAPRFWATPSSRGKPRVCSHPATLGLNPFPTPTPPPHPTPKTTATPTPKPTATPTPSPTPTVTPTPAPKPSPPGKRPPRPTPTPIYTPLPTITPTPTEVPTGYDRKKGPNKR